MQQPYLQIISAVLVLFECNTGGYLAYRAIGPP